MTRHAVSGDVESAVREGWNTSRNAAALIRLYGRLGEAGVRPAIRAGSACLRAVIDGPVDPASERAIELAEAWSAGQDVTPEAIEAAHAAVSAAAQTAHERILAEMRGSARSGGAISVGEAQAIARHHLVAGARELVRAVRKAMRVPYLRPESSAILAAHSAAHAPFAAAAIIAYGKSLDVSLPPEDPRGWVFHHGHALAQLAALVREILPCPSATGLGLSGSD
jgi:hypothetical protein